MAKSIFQGRLEAKIQKRIQEYTESVVLGSCADYAAYREQVGYLRGLADAIKVGEEIETEE